MFRVKGGEGFRDCFGFSRHRGLELEIRSLNSHSKLSIPDANPNSEP